MLLGLFLMACLSMYGFCANIPLVPVTSQSFINRPPVNFHGGQRLRSPSIVRAMPNNDDNLDWGEFYNQLSEYRKSNNDEDFMGDSNDFNSRYLEPRHHEELELAGRKDTVTGKMVDELITFKWIVNERHSNEIMFGAFIKDGHVDYLKKKILSKMMFYLCPAAYNWTNIATDIDFHKEFANASIRRKCIQIQATISDRPQLAIDPMKGMGWLINMRFNTVDIESHFHADPDFDQIARTLVAVVATYDEENEQFGHDDILLTSQTVRSIDMNGYFTTLNLLDSDSANSIDVRRLSKTPSPRTYQDAIDILRPRYYDLEGFRERYSELVMQFFAVYDGETEVEREKSLTIQEASERIDQALYLLEHLTHYKDDL